MKSSRENGTLRVPAAGILRVVDGIKFLGLSLGIVGDHHFERTEHREPAQRGLD